VTRHVTDRLSITPGLRYTYEEKEAEFESVVSGGLATANPTLIACKLALARPQALHGRSRRRQPVGPGQRLVRCLGRRPGAGYWPEYRAVERVTVQGDDKPF
jgi:hypothetical protein